MNYLLKNIYEDLLSLEFLLNVNPVYIILLKIDYVFMDILLLVNLKRIKMYARDGLNLYQFEISS